MKSKAPRVRESSKGPCRLLRDIAAPKGRGAMV